MNTLSVVLHIHSAPLPAAVSAGGHTVRWNFTLRIITLKTDLLSSVNNLYSIKMFTEIKFGLFSSCCLTLNVSQRQMKL